MNLHTPDATETQDVDQEFLEELKAVLRKYEKGLKPSLAVNEDGIVPFLQVIDVPNPTEEAPEPETEVEEETKPEKAEE